MSLKSVLIVLRFRPCWGHLIKAFFQDLMQRSLKSSSTVKVSLVLVLLTSTSDPSY